ncbi:MAG TPA: hypothetical protein VJC39_02925 [Candidatus Nanoarchaeia archaeon]|nr:hypothetical protein [Candidatus Nanoarchaeia archaeon]
MKLKTIDKIINFLPRASGYVGKLVGGNTGYYIGWGIGYTLEILALGALPVVGTPVAYTVAVGSPALAGGYKLKEYFTPAKDTKDDNNNTSLEDKVK